MQYTNHRFDEVKQILQKLEGIFIGVKSIISKSDLSNAIDAA